MGPASSQSLIHLPANANKKSQVNCPASTLIGLPESRQSIWRPRISPKSTFTRSDSQSQCAASSRARPLSQSGSFMLSSQASAGNSASPSVLNAADVPQSTGLVDSLAPPADTASVDFAKFTTSNSLLSPKKSLQASTRSCGGYVRIITGSLACSKQIRKN